MTSNYGYGNTAPRGAVTGYNDPEGTHGPHGSRIANAVDPRVDSDRDHRGAPGATTAAGGQGYGPGGFNASGAGRSEGYGPSGTVPGAGAGTRTGAGAGAGAYGAGNNAAAAGTGAGGGVQTTGAENTGERVARNIKGIFAQGHGIGESLRGNINSAIDSLTGDTTKQAHHERVAQGGYNEFTSAEFQKKGTSDKAL